MREKLKVPAASGELGDLYRTAIERYGATCLWNCSPDPSIGGMEVIASRLQKYGDLRAWYLAAKIKEAIENAPRPPSI